MELRNARDLILGLLVLAAWPACAQVFRCESANGVPEYTNTPRDRCARLDLAPLTTIPAPAQRRAPSGSADAAAGSTAPGSTPLRSGAGNGSMGMTAPSAATLRVDPATQKARDVDRRRILEEELAKEQARLESLRQEIGAAPSGQPKALDRAVRLREELGRTEGNLKALNREISSLKD
jgi:hypothetical protein